MENQALEKYQCVICGGGLSYLFSANDYISGDIFGVYKCPECNLAATKPDIDMPEKYYSKNYYGSRKPFVDGLINNSRARKIKNIAAGFKNKNGENSLLDIGCGDGGFIALLAKKGWKVFGTEICSRSAEGPMENYICRKAIADCKFQHISFDIVTMWHSLEHFAEPLIYLKEAERTLKKHGVLLLEVPNFNSWQSLIFKNNWFHLDVPRHVFHYDKKSLESILKKAGFKIIKISYSALIYDFFGLAQSWLNIFCKRKNLLFDLLGKKITRLELWRLPGGIKDLAATLLLLVPVSSLSLLALLFELIFKKGAIITVWAKKYA